MTQAAVQQLDETKRIGRCVPFVHQHESRTINNPLTRAELKMLRLTGRAAVPAVFTSHVRCAKQVSLLATCATRRSAVSTDGHRGLFDRAFRVQSCRALTIFAATSTTSRRETLLRLVSCEGGKVEMLVGVPFRRGQGRTR